MKEKNLILICGWAVILAGGLCSAVFKSAFVNYANVLNSNTKFSRISNLIIGLYEGNNKDEESKQIEKKIIDYYSDDSFQKFLDDDHALSADYEASDITKIISDFTSNKSSDFYLREEAATAFADMARAFSNAFEFKSRLTINSARRSQAFQRKLSSNCSKWRCANPGTSEHEAWLALDLWVNWWNIQAWWWKYYQRLIDNAHLYWFHNTYQRWMEIDGKIIEPRHWRYVWIDLATILHDNQQTFAEYFYSNVESKSEF